jgi:ribosomal protein S18 acetylase RimI-like enzyme
VGAAAPKVAEPQVDWPVAADEPLRDEVHRLIAAVVDLGGAVGWLQVPDRSQTDHWLDTRLAVPHGGLAVARVAGRVAALGAWAAGSGEAVAHVAQLSKIMVHPAARGQGLGRVITEALLAGCAAAGCELATLGVRGNNHGAIALYESLGFRTWGVLANGVAVGAQRFDDVRMARQLTLPADAVLHGSAPGGIGGSDRR